MDNEIALVPSVLYRYYKCDSWSRVFKNWTIRFSPFSEFNDPFEAMPAFKKIYSEGKRKEIQKMNPEWTNDFLDSLMSDENIYNLKNRIQKSYNIGVFCLTQEANNILMWSHYTDSHKGFVVGFDMESDFFKLGNREKHWRPMKVNYIPERHVFEHLFDLSNIEFEKFLYSKWEKWEYEDEYRMLCSLDDFQEVEGKKGICTIDKKAIKSVVFGVNMNAVEIKKCCEDLSGAECAHIRIQKAQLHQNGYSLVIKDL